MVHHSRCPFCGSDSLKVRFECTDHFISGEKFAVAECTSCGTLFTQDYPGGNDIYRYYESDDYISHSDTSAGFTNRIYHFIRKLMLRSKRALIKKATGLESGRLLDVGSGTGHFASVMKDKGWEVSGIEINEKARRFAAERFDLNFISPDEFSSLEKGSYDCITMWHVLEHFHDPGEYLNNLKSLLRPGGIMVIALPNSGSFDAIHFGAFWAAFDVPRHLWHFDPLTFSSFSSGKGMKIKSMHVLPFDVFYISILSEKYRGAKLHLFSGTIKGLWFTFRAAFSKGKNSSLIFILTTAQDQ